MAYLSLDWLSFTYKPSLDRLGELDIAGCFVLDFPELARIFLEECQNIGGRLHYNTCLKFNDDFMFLYNNVTSDNVNNIEHYNNQGLNVSVPSHSLELFFKLFKIDINDSSALWKMLKLLKDRSCQLSRIDLCFDDYDKRFTAEYYGQKWLNHYIVSAFRMASCTGSTSGGYTFYMGSLKKRNKLLRIYDKFKQTNGLVDCVRYEFELHAENARDCMNYLLEHKQLSFADYLSSWFRVLLRNDYQNVSTGLTDPEWYDFLAESVFCEEFGKFKIPKYSESDRKSMVCHWIENAVIPSLKGYIALYGWEHLNHLLDVSTINDKYRSLLDSLDFRQLLFRPTHRGFDTF